MPKLNPYLNFDGKAEEAFTFYKSVFGGEFVGEVMKIGNAPGSEKFTEEEKNRVLHIALPIGNDLLMASDILPSMGQKLLQGNSNYISVFPESREEADLFLSIGTSGLVYPAANFVRLCPDAVRILEYRRNAVKQPPKHTSPATTTRRRSCSVARQLNTLNTIKRAPTA